MFLESRSSRTALFCNFSGSEFWYLVNFSLQNSQIFKKSKFRASKCVKMVDFALLESPKSISHTFWAIEKLWNFHTVSHSEKLHISLPRSVLKCRNFSNIWIHLVSSLPPNLIWDTSTPYQEFSIPVDLGLQ